MNRLSPHRPRPGGGRRTAFVLSGGGSLGAVQVGMLKALFESEVTPDLLIGPSVGAVNAAWAAGRPDADGMAELADIWLGLRRQDVFPISPLMSAAGLLGRSNHFISNINLGSILKKNIPFERIEQASVPLHIGATDRKMGGAPTPPPWPPVP